MNTEILEDLGLSNIEVKVFLCLLELGETKAGKIIEKTKLQSSSVYNAINSLINRGFVSFIRKSEVKYYKAVEPDAVIDYIESKKSEYLKILPELEARQRKTDSEGVEFFKSFKGIRALFSKMIKNASINDVYYTFSVEDPQNYGLARDRVFRSIKQLMINKNIKMIGIFSEKNRYAPNKKSKMQKRYLSTPLPPNTSVLGNMVSIIKWGGEPSGILIDSKEIAMQYVSFFEIMWKIAKK